MKVLFVGDIVGKAGRRVVRELLGGIRKDRKIDFVIANGENAAGGIGLTPALADELIASGIDLITSGNHIWDKKEMVGEMDRGGRLLRPANYPPGVPGVGYVVRELEDGTTIAVANFSGRVYMPLMDCPFRAAQKLVGELRDITRAIFIDFHAEITSEKVAFGWHLDGMVTAIVGTHTHVQTADERILPQGTAYLTDLGMTGARDSVIGMKVDLVLDRFLTQMPTRFEAADENVYLSGAIVDFDPISGVALGIERLNVRLNGT